MVTTDSTTTSADLSDYLRIIRRHWALILLVTGICVGLAVIYTKVQTPRYDSSAKIRIPAPIGQNNRDQNIADLQTEVQVMKSDDVADRATSILKDGRSVQQLLGHLQVKTPTEARVLVVTYNGKSPDKARDGAKAFATAYVSYKRAEAERGTLEQVAALQPGIDALNKKIDEIETALQRTKSGSPEERTLNSTLSRYQTQLSQPQNQQDDLRSQLIDYGHILSPATLPRKPAGAGVTTNAAIGLLAGLVLGLILTFTRDRFDEQVREAADLQQVISVPNLGSIPILPTRGRKRSGPLVTVLDPEGANADAFRRLRGAVLLTLRARDAKVLAITSANAREGKSTVSANLAVTMGQAGHRVCLMSADVRRPTLDQFFQVTGHTGLMDVLDGSVALDDAIVPVAGLSLLTSGRPHGNPTDLLQSKRMEQTMAALRGRFDYIVVDTPPVLAVADVLGMMSMLDVVILVVSASETTEADITAAQTELRHVGTEIAGAVMNRSLTSTQRYAAYYRPAEKRPKAVDRRPATVPDPG